MEAVYGRKSGVLVNEALRPLLELLGVFRRPPILEIALRIKLAALIVESMCQLMTDHRSDAAVVYRGVHFVVVKRGLQNSGWKVDVVLGRVVVGVHGGRRHEPFGAIHLFPYFVELAMDFEFGGTFVIADGVASNNLDTRVIAPLVGISDFVGDRAQLNQRLLLGGRRHPGERLNVLAERLLDHFHHL